ncbi:hypothetical protein ILYODFUR_032561, partial [Ilyodon furcidens]
SLHCRAPSRTPLPFDWEVNGKELEKPTEDSSAERKHRWVYSEARSTKSWGKRSIKSRNTTEAACSAEDSPIRGQ